MFRGVIGKDNFALNIFQEFLKNTVSLQNRLGRSNPKEQFRCKRSLEEGWGISEKEKFVAQSLEGQLRSTISLQSRFERIN